MDESQDDGHEPSSSASAEEPPPSTSSSRASPRTNIVPTNKPILIIICPSGIAFCSRYRSLLRKMSHDCTLLYVLSLSDLNHVLTHNTPQIAGFIITDAKIMDSDSDEMCLLSSRIAALVCDKTREWTVVFAFDFPAQAARHPLRFGKYMEAVFGVSWKICGTTKGKVKLEIGEKALGKMGARVYRGNRYELRAVFLEGVEERDKVLVVAREASVRNGGLGRDGQPEEGEEEEVGNFDGGDDWITRCLRPKGEETDSTAGGLEGEAVEVLGVESLGRNGEYTPVPVPGTNPGSGLGHGGGGDGDVDMIDPEACREEHDWADDELTATETDTADEDGEVSTSSSDTDDTHPDQRVIYINAPDHRRNHTQTGYVDSDSAEEGSEAQKEGKAQVKAKAAKRVADCPVAIHEVKTWTVKNEEQVRVRGYVGFVGHVEDNRSMASLILGMCSVRNTRPLPESIQGYLRRLG